MNRSRPAPAADDDHSDPQAPEQRDWHVVPVQEVCRSLHTDAESGLDDTEAGERLARSGPNRLTPQSERTMLRRLAGQFSSLFIQVLLVAVVITAVLGEWLDSGVILAVVLIIAVIGFIQEGRAERALEAVSGMLTSRAQVIRGGQRREIPAEELVPGDLVLLEAGAGVPADVRVVESSQLQAQEAALTGESTAVEKGPEPVGDQAGIGDRSSIAHSGTVITAGTGKGIVVAVGDHTQIGRISGMLSEVESLKTPLMRRFDAFARTVSLAILALAAVSFAVGTLVWGRDWGDMFMAAVSIAVAAIPEGLPAMMTVTLAIGVRRMARRNAIIRRLPAVETLGSVTVICADKTGTLTRNEMTARTLRTARETIETEGTGYQPDGGFRIGGSEIALEEHPVAMEMARAGMLCNDATLRRQDDQWLPEGDPTETALIVLAHKAGLDPERENRQWPREDAIPFASERRYMATLHRNEQDGTHVIYVKGAPERLLEMCGSQQHGDQVQALDADAWSRHADEIAGRGQRVLAVARKDGHGQDGGLSGDQVEHDLVLLGLYGLLDPPREEAIRAVAACQGAGIRVKMITGDHALTAKAIARELHLLNPDEVLTGRELQDADDETLRRHAQDTDVFARASPEHKLRLVEALQSDGAVIAMTGDGVNDAPALKRADIGIAMGRKGTDAAREASAMVLADDNFASIERAVEEGRTVYDNLQKAILYILPTSVAESLVIVIAVMVGLVLPILPVQILWINMVTAVTLGMALAWEPAEGDLMQRQPRRPKEPLLTGMLAWRSLFVGVLLLLGAGGLFLYEQAQADSTLAYARTLVVNSLVVSEIAYLWNARFFRAPSWTLDGLLGNPKVLLAIGACLALQLMLIYVPFMNRWFRTEPLDAVAWAQCIAVAAAVFVLVEIEKALRRSRHDRGVAAAVTEASG